MLHCFIANNLTIEQLNNQTMFIKFKLTKKDYYLSSFYTFLTSKAIWLAVFCIPFGFLVTILQPPTLDKLLLIISFGVLLFFSVFVILIFYSVISKLRKDRNLLDSFQTLDLRSDGMFYFPREGDKGVYTPFIFKIIESPWHFYLYLTDKHVILIPKKEVNISEFRKLAKSKILTLLTLKSLILKNNQV